MRRPWLVLAVALVAALLLWWQQGGDVSTGDAVRPAPTPSPSSASAPASSEPTSSATVDPVSGLPWIDVSALPSEALHTLGLIDSGGPYPYDQDDSVFSNREGILPDEPAGYYHEYTVETPGSEDRGARRIVVGAPGEFYWTVDHYRSFSRIAR